MNYKERGGEIGEMWDERVGGTVYGTKLVSLHLWLPFYVPERIEQEKVHRLKINMYLFFMLPSLPAYKYIHLYLYSTARLFFFKWIVSHFYNDLRVFVTMKMDLLVFGCDEIVDWWRWLWWRSCLLCIMYTLTHGNHIEISQWFQWI